MTEFGAPQVDGYISRRRAEGAGEGTVYKALVVLRSALRVSIRAGLWRGRVDEVMPVAFSPEYEPKERMPDVNYLASLTTTTLPHRLSLATPHSR